MSADDVKVCPYCGEEIKSVAVKCRFCGSMLGGEPVTGQTWVIGPDTIIRQALAEKYEVLEAVGNGGMATVYKAVQKSLGRVVALKVIHQNLVHDQEFVKRFLREAQLAASLNHPNIVTVFDVGSYGQVHYMAMEFLEGEDMQQLMKKTGKLKPDDVVKWITPIAEALAYIHKNGLMHRDVKSPNIFITKSGRPVLTDFGIAFAADGTKLTQAGSIVGTPEYMSPEQANGKDFTAQSDLWSLGIVMYECLSGRVPFQGDNPLTTIHLVTQSQLPDITALNPQIPGWVVSILLILLAKAPSERFANGTDLAVALRERKEVKMIKSEKKVNERNGFPVQKQKLSSKFLLGTIGIIGLITVITAITLFLKNKPIQNQTITTINKPLIDSTGKNPALNKNAEEKQKVLNKLDMPQGASGSITSTKLKLETAQPIRDASQQNTAKQNELPLAEVGSKQFSMVSVLGGTLQVGQDGEQLNASNKKSIVQSVKVNSFYICKYEVTQAQWEEIMDSNPSAVKGKDLPVESVTWNEVQSFISKLNKQNNTNYRLPTEAEWDFAAKGGIKTKGFMYSGSNNISDVAWILSPSIKLHPVAMKKPNELGLYDMTGNADEWCSDWNATNGSSLQGDSNFSDSGSNQAVRGGRWNALAGSFRLASVSYRSPDNRIPNLGFRLAMTPK